MWLSTLVAALLATQLHQDINCQFLTHWLDLVWPIGLILASELTNLVVPQIVVGFTYVVLMSIHTWLSIHKLLGCK